MKIVPRVVLETEIVKESEIMVISQQLGNLRNEYGFDGFTLEMGAQISQGVYLAK